MIESGRERAHLPAVDGIKAGIRDWQFVAEGLDRDLNSTCTRCRPALGQNQSMSYWMAITRWPTLPCA